MISISTDAAIASRRRRLLRSSSPSTSTSTSISRQRYLSPDLHSHPRPTPPSKKVPLIQQTRTSSASEAVHDLGSSAPWVVAEDEYAGAMAARARLHARLRPNAPVTCTTRASSSVSVIRENTSTSKYPGTSRLEVGAASSTCSPSKVYTHVNSPALLEPRTDSHTDGRGPLKNPTSMPLFNTLIEAEECISEPDDCSICLESFSLGKILICWPCRHKFHYKCLNTWLEAHGQCPNCRAYILKVGSSRVSTGWLRKLYGINYEKKVSSLVDNLRTLQSIN